MADGVGQLLVLFWRKQADLFKKLTAPDRGDVVAVDHAVLVESVLRSDAHLAANAVDTGRDWGDGHASEIANGHPPGEQYGGPGFVYSREEDRTHQSMAGWCSAAQSTQASSSASGWLAARIADSFS